MTRIGTVVEVIIDSPGLALDKPFSYYAPEHQTASVQAGQRVVVSFHHQHKAGIIWAVRPNEEITDNMKPLLDVVDEQPVLTREQLELAEWLCTRYVCTLNDALSAILPGAFRVKGKMTVRLGTSVDVPDDVLATPLWKYVADHSPSVKEVSAKFGRTGKAQLDAWLEHGFLVQHLAIQEEVKASVKNWIVAEKPSSALLAAAQNREKRARRQADLLRQLAESDRGEIEWSRRVYNKGTVAAVVSEGLASVDERPTSRLSWVEVPAAVAPVLTEGQSRVVSRIGMTLDAGKHQTYLLHGVTGSGKTEVYIRSIEATLQKGKSAIVLVPEIALTPQMVGRFYARFGERIAVLHSGLTMGERRDEWGRILRGEANIVIGARSAVFAPVTRLGLLIVDEEHEPSYKQEESPHYDARDVAIRRSETFGAVTLFGSATPSLQALHLVEQGQAQILMLPVRANKRPLPRVDVIDMRDELREGNKSLFSSRLADEIEATVSANQQVILFLNRRGYAASMLCRACGERIRCPHCDISLTVHRQGGQMSLRCHYCAYEEPYRANCPACKEPALRAFGIGTEQIEEALKEQWPHLRVLRMDVDTTRTKGSLQRIVEGFERREADVLIGTQMIAKGLDFPHVRLVGVIAADTMLSVPDYRANERTFQLLTQVAGRAGRAETDGVTIIQTYRPEHFAITASSRHDFQTFYQEERSQREVFRYPPFCEMAVFLASHEDERLARGAASRFERELRRASLPDDVAIIPASPSGIQRIEDKFRYQVVLKYQHWDSVRAVVDGAFRLVKLKMNQYGGACRLDVNAQRIG
ncbi:primosomal protein N' [Alicyclobacillus dauci]|uniref:Replication restart protein PriA n=1 Tax=Alicyclobacillus dauci TaxID=1475485 RepID=A0ABY6YYI4_9BACL|nr:primosomal protein N' [Alicyclobacillus dauci]WAH35499.1 primosomal protein N' [Alicyclobacillus dauci]